MAVGDMLAAAEKAVREYAVYLSYDVDAARRRGDPDLASTLRERFRNAHALADELHNTNSATVAGARGELHAVRALAAQLVWRLGQLEPEIRREREAIAELSDRRGTLHVVAGKVVAYLRVSTEAQERQGFGLEVQEAAIREWARTNKARVAYVITDAGKSGADDHVARPGLAEALGHIKNGRANAIVVARLDRIARDLILQEWIRSELLGMGGQLRSADTVEDLHLIDDPDNPTGKLVRRILGAIAEYERDIIRLRMASGKETKRAAGGYAAGQPPYGKRAHDRELVDDLDEQRQIQRMRRWRRDGRSYREIADKLNTEGTRAHNGGRWHPVTVSRVLNRGSRKSA